MIKETLTAHFGHQVQTRPEKTALMERCSDLSWASTSYKEWNTRSRSIASALIRDGVGPGESVAIFSYSRREWVEADMGILLAGAKTATIYQNLAGETVGHILSDSDAKLVFAEGPLQLKALFANDRKLPDALEKIVYFQSRQTPPHRAGKPVPAEVGLEEVVPEQMLHLLVPYEDYVKYGKSAMAENYRALEKRIDAIEPDTIARVVYTSGTTGIPKGAMLSHGALMAVTSRVDETLGITAEELSLLFLPLAHVYAQLVYHCQLRIGFTIAFGRSMLTAIEDAESIKPHFFVSVPRLFEKIYAGVLASVEQGSLIKKTIFRFASDTGSQMSKAMQHKKHPGIVLRMKSVVANELVFSKLKKKLGGRVRMMISGGAPISAEIQEFFHAAGLLIIEGYGMTENSSLSHHNRIDDFKFGTVGKPLDVTEVIIADDNEILVRGPQVMQGYLNLAEETRESVDSAGWLHTGDIGVIDTDGFLKITDRKKDIIVTSGGKNIAPAPIEMALSDLKLVSQAVVFGNKRKFLSALITLDDAAALQYCADNNIGTEGAMHQNPRILSFIEAEIDRMNQRLERYETIKKFAIAPTEFSIDSGEVTPSLKLRKKIIEEKYGHLVQALYD